MKNDVRKHEAKRQHDNLRNYKGYYPAIDVSGLDLRRGNTLYEEDSVRERWCDKRHLKVYGYQHYKPQRVQPNLQYYGQEYWNNDVQDPNAVDEAILKTKIVTIIMASIPNSSEGQRQNSALDYASATHVQENRSEHFGCDNYEGDH